jgi:hypothetical protein
VIAVHGSKQSSGDGYLELRVKYPGHPYIAQIDGLDNSCNLNRRWIGMQLYDRREHHDDGSQEQVYRLPLVNAIYEIREKIDGKNFYRYVAVYDGELHRLTRDVAESIAEKSMTLQQWCSSRTPGQV